MGSQSSTGGKIRNCWLGAWLVVVMALATTLAMPVRSIMCVLSRESRTKPELTGLIMGMKAYRSEYDHWPPAEDIFRILEGEDIKGNNPRKIPFYYPGRGTSPDGAPLDGWGRSLVFDGIIGEVPRFHSIGKDGIDQHGAKGSDDVVSWR